MLQEAKDFDLTQSATNHPSCWPLQHYLLNCHHFVCLIICLFVTTICILLALLFHLKEARLAVLNNIRKRVYVLYSSSDYNAVCTLPYRTHHLVVRSNLKRCAINNYATFTLLRYVLLCILGRCYSHRNITRVVILLLIDHRVRLSPRLTEIV